MLLKYGELHVGLAAVLHRKANRTLPFHGKDVYKLCLLADVIIVVLIANTYLFTHQEPELQRVHLYSGQPLQGLRQSG